MDTAAGLRIERDSMGEVQVPADRLYGASTARALANFPISGVGMPRALIVELARIKRCAAAVNAELGLLDAKRAELIERAAREIEAGEHEREFPIDIFQTGSGTSTNMNLNEVIANRCAQLAGEALGGKKPVHPNDHVNLGQSSNDAFPTAIHLAALRSMRAGLSSSFAVLGQSLAEKAQEFHEVIKIGRTHWQDATPLTVGQEFSGFASQIAEAQRRIAAATQALSQVPLGGTAVGTGLNTHPDFARLVCRRLAVEIGCAVEPASNHFAAQGGKDALVESSGLLKTIAVSLTKIANDLRILGSGPRCGLGELRLPAVQPGSSIMPGKTNPVICEAVIQAAVQVMGNDATIAIAACGGIGSILQLNVAMPVIARNLLESIGLLANAAAVLASKAVDGLEVDRERCDQLLHQSLALATKLVPAIGYDRAAQLAQRAYHERKTLRQTAEESGWLIGHDLDKLLDPAGMTGPGLAPGGDS